MQHRLARWIRPSIVEDERTLYELLTQLDKLSPFSQECPNATTSLIAGTSRDPVRGSASTYNRDRFADHSSLERVLI